MADLFDIASPAPTLIDALLALAARDTDHASIDNGIGFNGGDTMWGARLAGLARAGRLRWRDEAEYVDARHRLLKYARQLAVYGIDFAAIPSYPSAVEMRAPQNTSPDALGAKSGGASLVARVPGRCALCGGQIAAGASFAWGQERGDRIHIPACQPAEAQSLTVAPLAPQEPRREQATQQTVDLGTAGIGGPASVLGPGGLIAKALPGYQSRPSQVQLSTAIQAAMGQGRNLVAEAPTGVGKSLAYAVAAVLTGKKTIVSTALKSLQEQLAQKDLPFLANVMNTDPDKPLFTFAVLKGRSNYLCLHRAEQVKAHVAEWADVDAGAFKSAEANAQWPEVLPLLDMPGDGDLENWPLNLASELKAELSVTSDECLGRKCPFFDGCLVEGAKARAAQANIVVVNHALLLRDLQVRALTEGGVSLLPHAAALVIDEAHNLEEQATEAFGVEVSLGRWLRFKRRLEQLVTSHKAVREAERIVDQMASGQASLTEGNVAAETVTKRAAWWAEALDAADYALLTLFGVLEVRLRESGLDAQRLGDVWEPHGRTVVSALGSLFAAMDNGAPGWLDDGQRAAWEKLAASADKLGTALHQLTREDDNPRYVRYCQMEGSESGRRLVLYAKPIEVDDVLREHLWGTAPATTVEDVDDWSEDETAEGESYTVGTRRAPYASVISVSATIATDAGFRYWRDRVGLDETAELIVGSPFDFPRMARTYVPEDAAAFDPSAARNPEEREAYFDRLSARTLELVRACPNGGAFLLYTSNVALKAVYARIGGALERDGRLVLRQGEDTRQRLTAAFKADGKAVLFGVKSFSEGIDIQGNALSLVVINAMPFNPPTDPVWDAKCRAVDRKAGRDMAWFMALALPTAVIALKQSFGRLIRTHTDRGVVALMDGRLNLPQKRYGERVLSALPPARRIHSIAEVAAFFGGTRPIAGGSGEDEYTF